MAKYVIIRCSDNKEVARFDYFPASDRSLMYRENGRVFFRDFKPGEILGTPELFSNMLVRAGYEPVN